MKLKYKIKIEIQIKIQTKLKTARHSLKHLFILSNGNSLTRLHYPIFKMYIAFKIWDVLRQVPKNKLFISQKLFLQTSEQIKKYTSPSLSSSNERRC